jgi:hypothetical protein
MRGSYGRKTVLLLGWLLAAGLVSVATVAWAESAPDAIGPRGGSYFAGRYALPVRAFLQDDPRWGGEHLGPSSDTLADEGCAVTSVAMVLHYYGVDVTPATLNRFFTARNIFDAEGYLDFGRVAEIAPDRVWLASDGAPSFREIDGLLLQHHPVILQLTLFDGGRHFVVVAGKQGYDYLVCDPASGDASALTVLKDIAERVDRQYVYLRPGGT